MKPKDISPRWSWLPLGILAAIVVARYSMPAEAYRQYVEGREQGLVEWLTPVVLLPGIVYGLLILRLRASLPGFQSRLWLLMVTLGAIYMAGEEISWGQWLFHWDTPETYAAINKQSETNLHNSSTLFNQKPRLLLELWVLAGAIRAWYRSYKGRVDDTGTTAYWFWPTLPLALTGLLSALAMMPERVLDWWSVHPPFPFDIDGPEAQELILGVFLSLFLASAHTRLKSLKNDLH